MNYREEKELLDAIELGDIQFNSLDLLCDILKAREQRFKNVLDMMGIQRANIWPVKRLIRNKLKELEY